MSQNLKQGFGKTAYSKLESTIKILCIDMFIDPCLYCLSAADFTHCGDMTEAMEIYESCMSAVAVKAKIAKARKTWILAIVISGATIFAVTLILVFLHRRYKRKNRKKKVNVNNNTDHNAVSPPEEQETSSDEMLNEARV
jgi:hypothetical protein